MASAWRDVWILGVVSLINDISGEVVVAVLPFLLLAQGASGVGIGLVGGVSEGIGHLMKLAGGYLDQRIQRPKLMIGTGYLAASLSRLGVAFATGWGVTLAFRSLDRVGKGIRTAPRDAMLAGAVGMQDRGRAFGLHRAADTSGAVIGVVLVMVGLAFGVTEGHLVLVGALIGLTSLIPLFWLKGDGAGSASRDGTEEKPSPRYKPFLATATLFYLGRVSFLFFILRASGEGPDLSGGVGAAAAVGGYLLFNIVYAASSYPAGWLADRRGHGFVLAAGFLLGALASATFMLHPNVAVVAGGFALLGLSFAAVEGNARSVAAHLAGSRSRSGRLGEYHALTGVATVVGGVAAGLLWDHVSPEASFAFGAILSLLALACLVLLRRGGDLFHFRAHPLAPEGQA